jgi:hypothetical protein
VLRVLRVLAPWPVVPLYSSGRGYAIAVAAVRLPETVMVGNCVEPDWARSAGAVVDGDPFAGEGDVGEVAAGV